MILPLEQPKNNTCFHRLCLPLTLGYLFIFLCVLHRQCCLQTVPMECCVDAVYKAGTGVLMVHMPRTMLCILVHGPFIICLDRILSWFAVRSLLCFLMITRYIAQMVQNIVIIFQFVTSALVWFFKSHFVCCTKRNLESLIQFCLLLSCKFCCIWIGSSCSL